MPKAAASLGHAVTFVSATFVHQAVTAAAVAYAAIGRRANETLHRCASRLRNAWHVTENRVRSVVAAIVAIPVAIVSFIRLVGLGCVVLFLAIVLLLDVSVHAAAPRLAGLLRSCANWIWEDIQDVANCARRALLAARRLWREAMWLIVDNLRLLAGSIGVSATELAQFMTVTKGLFRSALERCRAGIRALRLAFGDVATERRVPTHAVAACPTDRRVSLQQRASRHHRDRVNRAALRQPLRQMTPRRRPTANGIAQRWARFRYWRYRTFRFVRSYAIDTSAKEHALNVGVFLFGILIAVGGQGAIQFYSENRAQTDFERPGKEVVVFLTDTIARHLDVLETAQRGFTARKTPPNRWAFFQSTRDTLKDLPGIQAIEWVPRVRARYRSRYEKRAVKDGLFGFKFFGPNGTPARAEDGEHFPIYYVEPYPGNEGALGFDLAGDPTALQALRKARDTGKPVTTAYMPVDLGDKAENRSTAASVVVVVLPVYNTEVLPFTTQERRKRITGFIRGVVRLDRMVQSYRSNLSVPPGLEVAFYRHDDSGTPRLRYYNPPLPANAKPLPYPNADKSDDINLTAPFSIVDQNWSMVLRPESRLFLRNLSSASWAFAIFAFLTTAMLLLYLVTSQTRTRMIERSVAQRTVELEAEIAQRKRIEVELREAKDEAVNANHAKSEFLAIMSHELRTPLNAISGFSEVMSNEVYGELGHKNYTDYASFIYDSADHLLSLINDILDLSKIEAERYEIHKEEINLAAVWRPVEEMLGEQIAAAEVTLEDCIADSPIRVRADERAFRQIFLNLLSNAIKFTPEGGRIETRADIDRKGRLLISVSDTGIGISKEDLDSVFEPFKQVESKVARKHKGTGLGLPLTQRLVELHGGHMEIESVLGEGTTIRIVLMPDSVLEHDNAAAAIGQVGVDRSGLGTEPDKPVTAKAAGDAVNWENYLYAKG